MRPLDWLAAGAAFVLFPVPLFWLVLHPFAGFWRARGMRAAYATAVVVAWGAGAAYLLAFRERLFSSAQAPLWAIVVGLALLAGDAFMLRRVHVDLGGERLMGKTELAGGGELVVRGIYARVRHPRYTAMMAAMLGVCLIAGTLLLWATGVVCWALTLISIALEEKELLARFGREYEDYRRRVPAFLPLRFWPKEEEKLSHR